VDAQHLDALVAAAEWMGDAARLEFFIAATLAHVADWHEFILEQQDTTAGVDLSRLISMRSKFVEDNTAEPWQNGARAARVVRHELGRGAEAPVDAATLG